MNKGKTDTYAGILIYLYLALPVLIFMAGWLRWCWALPFCMLTACACIRGFTESARTHCLTVRGLMNKKTVLAAFLLIVLWVYLSGVGGFCYQNRDHAVRNAIFRALVERSWPVISYNGKRGLIYYIGFWLPAACVGKLFGLEAGYAVQLVWAVLGVFITYYLICVYRGKTDLLPVIFLIFFSGLDYVGTCIYAKEGMDLRLAAHLEWWATDFQFTSTTAQLFWVFNQSVPAWVASMLILVQKNSKNMLFILGLSMLTSTIPFVGLIPIAVYLYIGFVREDRSRWKEVFTFQNVVGVVVIGGVSFLYLIGNVSGGKIGQAEMSAASAGPWSGLLRYLLFCFLEFGIYLCFIWKYRRKDPLFWLMIGILAICPLIRVGSSSDFCMRASVPALLVLMLYCMEAFEKRRREGKRWAFAVYCVVLLLGAVTPFNEIHRTIRTSVQRIANGEPLRHWEVGIERSVLKGSNFSGETEGSLFYRILAKPLLVIDEDWDGENGNEG